MNRAYITNLNKLCEERNILHLAQLCNVKISDVADVLKISVKEILSTKKKRQNTEDIVYVIFALCFEDMQTAEILTNVWNGYLYLKLDKNGEYLVIDSESGRPAAKISLKN
ncbi:MAG: hypothetical protein IJ725_02010 [Ruminococcus sp.]|nr:hypothetical protein [Ruminococcus sp.]